MPFSMTNVLGHAAYLLLIGASLVRTILPLRLLAIGSGLCSIVYSTLIHDRPGLFWESIFTVVNIVQAVMLVQERRQAQLTEEEEKLRQTTFGELPVVDFHRLVRVGTWVSAPAGAVLACQGQPVARLLMITDGAAAVRVDGEVVAYCRRGDYVGEMAFVSGKPAAATVETIAPSRCLSWSAPDLKALLERYPDIRASLQSVMSLNLTDKLRRDTAAMEVAQPPG
jgi:hypothetical protein